MAFSFGGGANKTGFGTTTTSSGPTFGFGQTTQSSAFSGFGTSQPSTGSTFGTGLTSSTGFGTGTLGSTGFGTSTSLGSTGFGTGTTGLGSGTTGLGTGTTGFGTGTTGLGTGTTGFGTGTAGFGTGTSGFGTGTTGLGTNTLGSLGSTGFGTATSGATGFGTSTLGGAGFGTGTTGLGSNVGQQAQQQTPNTLANMATAVSLPLIFGDERDAIIAKWNQLQAFWGTGKGFFNQNSAVDFNPSNPFCRFKAIGYSCIPTTKNEDGLVSIVFNKNSVAIQENQTQIVDALHRILGSKTNLSVCVEGVKGLPDNKTEMVIYIQERSPTGTTKRILASDVYNFLTQNNIKNQLVSQLLVENVVPKTGFSPEQLKQYLEVSPDGVDPILWQQAKLDNPDPEKLIPVLMVGFQELHKRLKHQEQQTKLHQARLDVINDDISHLQRSHSNIMARTEQYKRKHLELGHRVLQVMVRQEVYRKLGYAVQADEEQLRVQVEAIQAELNAPTQFKGRLNELMSLIRMQNQLGGVRAEVSYQVDAPLQQEIRQHLKHQQEGLQHLISIIKDDLEDLKLIEHGLIDTVRR